MKNKFQNKIVGHGEESPLDIKMNPLNFRLHDEYQQKSVKSVLNDVGWIQSVIINKVTGNLIDGHLRVSLAIQNNEEKIPVIYVQLKEEDERKILATLDYSSKLAQVDKNVFLDLIEGMNSDNNDFTQLISDIYDEFKIVDDIKVEPEDLENVTEYTICINLENESEQRDLYERLTKEGYTCKLIM